jgi:hypothetical protein
MPVIMFTAHEVFESAIDASRELSTRILKLADLNANPLAPGETADTRRHQIAKLGKALAESFMVIDKLVVAAAEHAAKHYAESDVTAGPIGMSSDKPDNPNSN